MLMNRDMRILAGCLLIGLFLLVAPARGENIPEHEALLAARLDSAMRAVCYAVRADNLSVKGHAFEVGAARFARAGDLTIIEGELAYRAASQPSRAVSYKIRKRGAVLVSAEMHVQPGQHSRTSTALARHLVGVVVRDDQLESVARRIARQADGQWESAAELIVTSIALRADAFGRDRLAMYRAKLSHALNRPSRDFGRSARTIIVPRSERQPQDRG
jgi:hypothetical protein